MDVVATVQEGQPPRVLVTVTGIAGQAPNLLTNPGFETGTLTGWTQATAATLSVVSGNAASGNYHGRAINNAGAGGRQLYTALVPAVVGKGYTGTLKLRGREGLLVTVLLRPATTNVVDGTVSAPSVALPLIPDVWQEVTTSILTPSGTHNQLRLEVNATAPVAGDVIDLDDGYASEAVGSGGIVALYRVVGGTRTLVRGGRELIGSAGNAVLVDNEAPFGEPVTYVATQQHDDGTTTEAVSNEIILTTALPWLTNPITGAGLEATIQTWPELTYSARQTIIGVSGRAFPVAVSDARLAASSELVLHTTTRSQLADLRDLLAGSEIVQVRPPCEAVEPSYVAVGDVTETRREEFDGASWERLVSLEVQAVDAPSPSVPAVGDTLVDLHNYAPTTLADLAISFGTNATLLTIASTQLSEAG